MKSRISFAMIAGLLFVGSALYAQAPAGAPAGTTGKCKDGTYTSQATKQGACRGHKGVDTWYAAASASTPAAASKTAAAPAKTAQTPAASPTAKPAPAPAPSGAMPAGATGKCKDGTYTTQATKQGACRGHQGVDTWFAAASSPAPTPTPTPAAKQATAPPPAAAQPAPAATPSPAAQKSTPPRTSSSDKPVAPGGGQGLVWVNAESNVYHCYGTQWYGKTKAGKYETEAAAKAAGARPDRGKPCGQ